MKIVLGLLCLVLLLLAVVEGKTSEYIANSRDIRFRRGFKNAGLSTARGFGKRASDLQSSAKFAHEESFPLDMVLDYMEEKPEMLRSFVERYLDPDEDGQVTTAELKAAFKDS